MVEKLSMKIIYVFNESDFSIYGNKYFEMSKFRENSLSKGFTSGLITIREYIPD